jgi:hypothetical protein
MAFEMLPDTAWVEKMRFNAEPHCHALGTRHRADTMFIVTMAARIMQMQSGRHMLGLATQQNSSFIVLFVVRLG